MRKISWLIPVCVVLLALLLLAAKPAGTQSAFNLPVEWVDIQIAAECSGFAVRSEVEVNGYWQINKDSQGHITSVFDSTTFEARFVNSKTGEVYTWGLLNNQSVLNAHFSPFSAPNDHWSDIRVVHALPAYLPEYEWVGYWDSHPPFSPFTFIYAIGSWTGDTSRLCTLFGEPYP
jgi:hypothetical protein